MSASDSSSLSSSTQEWEPLPPLERRILGVLIEKQKTSKTADTYPLSLNGLVNGCNQKSNRDPVLELDEVDVEEVLTALQKKLLVARITGGRVERFRHTLYETWTQRGTQLAVMAELLLRGPQTKGDLRSRAARMDPIDTLDDLDEILKELAARSLVIYLNDPERRGAVVTHGFHEPSELAELKARYAGSGAIDSPRPVSPPAFNPPTSPNLVAILEAQVAELRDEIAELNRRITALETATDISKR